MIPVKTSSDLVKMRKAGKITGDVLKYIEEFVKPGVTTLELDAKIEEFILKAGAKPCFKGLYGFPASACISVDEVVVHGIPSNRPLKEGEIVSIDVGARIDGFNGDAARTFPVGQISAEKQRLIDVTRESFFEGMKHARAGRRIGDMCSAIQQFVEKNGDALLRYEIEESGPEHNKTFIATAYINNNKVGDGKGSTKRAAEMQSAKVALRLFGII